MDPYEYLPLQGESDIRLMTILPGDFDDPIRAEITHTSLVPPEEVETTRLSVEEINRTLPKRWKAYGTREGRIIFHNSETGLTSWIHPDPNVERALYDPIPARKIDLSVPVYEALSYAWGAPEKDGIMEVIVSKTMVKPVPSDCFLTRKLPITHNLELTLRYIRLRDRPRMMWIDAVCIDQNNGQEQSAQVRRMGEIFSLASGVVAWLGPSFVDSRLALTTLEEIGQQIELVETRLLILPSPQCSPPDWAYSNTQIPLELNQWAAITQLCEVPYVNRLWIVQELALASADSVVQCGHDAISWPLFRRAILLLDAKIMARTQEMSIKTIHGLYSMAETVGNYTLDSLPTILHTHHERECADARDKVYACMNLLDPAVRKHIIVDYSKSPLDVFKQVFLVFLAQEKRLAQLPLAGNCTFPASTWPTWLPNWSQPLATAYFSPTHMASGMSAACTNYTAPNKLDVAGISFAHISTGIQALPKPDLSDVVEFLKGLGLEGLQASTYPNGETRLNAYLMTFCRGYVDDRLPSLGYATLSQIRHEVMKLAAPPECAEQSTPIEVLRSISTHNAIHMFTTDNGYIGSADTPIQPGDEVFIILGCDHPMILRPTSNGEYQVVGSCYIHGAMDGEVLLGELPYPWKIELEIDKRGNWMYIFQNSCLDEWREDDPRLDSIPIPAEWEPIEFEWTRSDPDFCRKFRNRDTGEIINSDPRLSAEALLERGIPVKTITLI
ncbi:HET-domain-containing protein [Xylaria sp. FL1042]|nr:HET-domain-containing protein [Xylaria sp. FL1042]